MMESSKFQAARRLITTLGPGACSHATQNALDMRAGGDARLEVFWLDVVDTIKTLQSAGRLNAVGTGFPPCLMVSARG